MCPVSRIPPTSRPAGITRSRKGLEPVPRVRAHRLPGQRAQLPASRPAADHPAQAALKYLDPRALAAPREVGGKPETPLGPGLGQAAHHRPAETVPGIGQPALQPRHRYLPRPVGCRSGTGTTLARAQAGVSVAAGGLAAGVAAVPGWRSLARLASRWR